MALDIYDAQNRYRDALEEVRKAKEQHERDYNVADASYQLFAKASEARDKALVDLVLAVGLPLDCLSVKMQKHFADGVSKETTA